MRFLADTLLARIIQIPGMRSLWVRFPFGSIPTRVQYDIWDRPHYAYGVYSAADLAQRLRYPGITAIEFGVAGGRGLVALEEISKRVGAHLGMEIAVFGFDSGEGMPAPLDYRDLPHVWNKGFYQMRRAELETKLTTAKLIIGDIQETIPSFVSPYPVGFIAFDLDYYSSTRNALYIFEADHLPRTYCYFDDTIWPERACHNENIGELCAIREFNEQHANTKLCQIHGLRYMRSHDASWHEQMYVFHDFRHPLYSVNITSPGDHHTQLWL